MDLEDFGPILALLVGVGLIFGTFVQFQSNVLFGFAWFTNMLWFAIGFPVLFIISWLVFAFGIKGHKKLAEET